MALNDFREETPLYKLYYTLKKKEVLPLCDQFPYCSNTEHQMLQLNQLKVLKGFSSKVPVVKLII